MKVWRAYRNMLRAAARDPVWALSAIPLVLFAPERVAVAT